MIKFWFFVFLIFSISSVAMSSEVVTGESKGLAMTNIDGDLRTVIFEDGTECIYDHENVFTEDLIDRIHRFIKTVSYKCISHYDGHGFVLDDINVLDDGLDEVGNKETNRLIDSPFNE